MADLATIFLACAFSVLLLKFLQSLRQSKRRNSLLPPGPTAWPLLGNLLDVPVDYPWKTYAEWGSKYGDLTHITAFGQHIMVINSDEVAIDLLEKRSRNYADRPEMPIIRFMGWNISMGLMRYGEEWRTHRRLFHQKFRPESIQTMVPVVAAKAHDLLIHLLDTPNDFDNHMKNYPSSVVMYLAYGHEIAPKDDPIMKVTEEAMSMLSEAVFPGAQAMNTFPILWNLPTWFPGAGFKIYALKCREVVSAMQDLPFGSIKSHMKDGTAVPSWTTELIEKYGATKDQEDFIKSVGAVFFAGATDSTIATLRSFILMMIQNPAVQKKAQAEIDSVVGNKRLPSYDDKDSLPYIEALYREVLRCRPAAPIGVPHAAIEDDVYNGYFIPKGTTVIANLWAISYDERVYTNPQEFQPERFLKADGTISDAFPPVFGYGRRSCVGRHMAHATIWMAIASILSVFDIGKAIDADGNVIEVSGVYSGRLVSFPEPYKASFTPRSEKARALIVDTPRVTLATTQLVQ